MRFRFCVLALIGATTIPFSALAQRSTPVQLLHPAGAKDDRFGASVAVDGDTMIVGAPYDAIGANTDRGSVHVFLWTGSGWTFEATLTASDGEADDHFGRSVAIFGDTVIVGAWGDDIGSNVDQGSVYVFQRAHGGATWNQQAKLTAADGAAGDLFGGSVALSGDSAFVGAYGDDVGANTDQGSAYVFRRLPGGNTWEQQAKITASDGAPGDAFGESVGLSTDTVVVGAAHADVDGNADQGAAYVFSRAGVTWTQQAKLTAHIGTTHDYFGLSVAISDQTVIIGSGISDGPDRHVVYVFVESGGIWTQQTKLTPPPHSEVLGEIFGERVAISGDTAIIGSSYDNSRGAAYVFKRSGSMWSQQAQLTAPDGEDVDQFGVSVAISGDFAVVGASRDDVGTRVDQGSAWAFSRVGSDWIGPDLALLSPSVPVRGFFGSSVDLFGDTAIVGEAARPFSTDPGAAFIFTRSGTAWTQQAQLTPSDGEGDDHFGISSALSGDTAIVCAFLDDVGSNDDQGSAYVFTRSGTAWTQQAKLTAADGAAGDLFGWHVAISGDTAIVGVPYDAIASDADQGSAYIFVRSGTTWTQQAKLTASDGAAGDRFGDSVALSDDTAIVGAYADDVGGNSDQGSAYVFTRSGTTWTQRTKLTASDGAAGDHLGDSVALSGDTAIVGATGDTVGGNVDQGSVYVFNRTGITWTQQAKLTASDGAADDWFGRSIAIKRGDVNTLIVGASSASVDSNLDQGAAYIFTRSGITWTQQAKLTVEPSIYSLGYGFGNSVAIGGEDGNWVGVGFPGDYVTSLEQGSVRVFNVIFNDSPLALNDSTGVSYPTLDDALPPALSGHQITATEAAWRSSEDIDTSGRSLDFQSRANLRTPFSSTITLGGTSSLAAANGAALQMFGKVRVPASALADFSAKAFSTGSRASLTAFTGASLTVDAQSACLYGDTRLEPDASLSFGGTVESNGRFSALFNNSLTLTDTFTNRDTFTMSLGSISTPLFFNRAQVEFSGDCTVLGSYRNAAGAVTFIPFGSLFVSETLTNNGEIFGATCAGCLAAPPRLKVGTDLILGSDAGLLMPFSGAVISVGGDFDCAIDSHSRFDLRLATLQFDGSNSAQQTMEAMSKDIGDSASGLNQTVPGNYPVHTLRIGPTPTTIYLIDAHDNDGLGQSAAEAIYVDTLQIDSGSRLANAGRRIYCNTLINNGTIDVPGNVLPLAAPCPADLNNDNQVDDADFQVFIPQYNALDCADPAMPGNCSADLNKDNLVDDADFQVFVVAYDQLLCL